MTGLSRYLVKLSVESSTHAEVEESGIELGLIDPPTWILHFLFSFSLLIARPLLLGGTAGKEKLPQGRL